jgi:hypothetical protein
MMKFAVPLDERINNRMRHTDVFIGISLFALTLIIGWLVMVPGVVGVFHDDGIYVATAESLASGHGYRLANLPGAPFQSKYPPLFPMLLALIWKMWPVFPDNLLAMHWFTLVMSALSVGLCYYYVTEYGYFNRPVALAAAALAVSSHYFLYYSTLPLAEMPFSCLLCAALIFYERYLRMPTPGPGAKLLMILLLVLPFLTRTIGLALIPVALIILVLRRRFSWFLAISLVVLVSAWFAWGAMQPKPPDLITGYYTSYASWWSQLVGYKTELRVLGFNFIYIIFGIGSLGSTVVSGVPFLDSILTIIKLLLGVFSLIGICVGIRKKWMLPCFLAFYLLAVLLWPWPPARFIMPVLIFLIGYALDRIWRFAAKRHHFKRGNGVVLAGSFILGIILAANISNSYRVACFNKSIHYPSMMASMDKPFAWSSFLEVFTWIKTHTMPTDVMACPLDSLH